jgi:hypothetical protein
VKKVKTLLRQIAIVSGPVFVAAVALAQGTLPSLADPKIQVFQIESLDHRERCSATLIPYNDLASGLSCRLVTNAHCATADHQPFALSTPKGTVSTAVEAYFGKLSRPETVVVTKMDRGADLAELSVPKSLQSSLCGFVSFNDDLTVEERLTEKNADPSGASKTAYYAALGFHGGQAIANFADDGDWARGVFAPSILYRAQTSLKSLSYVYNFMNLPLANGMSGGATIDSDGHFVGINVRLVQFQDESYVIPLKDVLLFLDSSGWQKTGDSISKNGTQGAGENSGVHAGENSGSHSGENSGVHAGENSGVHAGDNDDPTPIRTSPLSMFREPDEGVQINVNGEMKRLLGIGPHQIDGFDDLRMYERSGGSRIFRGSSRFNEIRQRLFSRLEGDFRPAEAVVPDAIFQWDARTSTWTPASKGHAGAWIVVKRTNDRQAVITMNYFDPAGNGARVDYKALLSQDGARISLVRSDTNDVLQCENSNYLKLICFSDNEELSLSLTESGGAILSFRSARLQKDGSVRFGYGRLQRFSK